MTTVEDHDRAVLDCYRCLFEACLDHDLPHMLRARDALAAIPLPRDDADALVEQQTQGQ